MDTAIIIAIAIMLIAASFFMGMLFGSLRQNKIWQENIHKWKNTKEIIVDEYAIKGFEDDWKPDSLTKIRRIRQGCINFVKVIQ